MPRSVVVAGVAVVIRRVKSLQVSQRVKQRLSSVVAVFVRPSGPARRTRKARLAALLELREADKQAHFQYLPGAGTPSCYDT